MEWDRHHKENKRRKDENLQDSLDILVEAKKLARDNDLVLEQHSQWHFSLTCNQNGDRKWRLNIYPSNQRIWWDKKCGKTPFIELPEIWNLLDVVKKAAE